MAKDIVNKSELKAKAESDHVTAKDRQPPDLSAEGVCLLFVSKLYCYSIN